MIEMMGSKLHQKHLSLIFLRLRRLTYSLKSFSCSGRKNIFIKGDKLCLNTQMKILENMSKITCKIAADYLGISPMAVSIGMRNDLLPIGFAIHNEERDRTYSESWSYHIIGERLIAYKYGKTSEVQVQNIEKSLNTIIEQFEEMKKDLVFLLSENEDQQN